MSIVNKFILLCFFFLIMNVQVWAHPEIEIAFTFDDAPRGDTLYFTGLERGKQLIKSLERAEIKEAMFLCTPKDWTQENQNRLQAYNDAGHLIANHTNDHLSLDNEKVSSSEFILNIKLAHERLKGFSHFVPYFRFPYLHQGNSLLKIAEVSSALKELSYQQAYVTIESYDWQIDSVFQDWLKSLKAKGQVPSKLQMERIRSIYLNIMRETIEFYRFLAEELSENKSDTQTEKTIRQVILLHENDLNALFLPDLVALLKRNHYKIVNPIYAFSDPQISNRSGKDIDSWPYSMHRLRSVAKHKSYEGLTFSIWEDEDVIKKYFNENVL